MIKTLRKSAYKNGYLVITAAWLYTLSFIFINYWSYTSSPGRVKQRLQAHIQAKEEEFTEFAGDTSLLLKMINQSPGSRSLQYIGSDEPGLFTYQYNDLGNLLLSYWNTSKMYPQDKELARADGKYFVRYPNGEFEFIKRSFVLQDKQVVCVALIPIRWNYFVKTRYLQTSFAGVGSLDDKYDLVDKGGVVSIQNGDGKVLFGLKLKENNRLTTYDPITIALRVLALIFVLVFVNVLATDVSKNEGQLKGFAFLAAFVFFIRLLSYYIHVPFNYRHLELFEPFIYASNSIHPSLGDLLVNMILAFWLVSFFKLTSLPVIAKIKPVSSRASWVICILLSGILLFISFTAAGVVRSLIVDSKISFDVVNFFGLSVYTFISFFVLCFITLTFFHLSHIILLLLHKLADLPWYAKYIVITIIGLITLSLTLPGNFVESNLFVLVWLLLYLFIMEQRVKDLYKPLMRSSFFVVWLIYFAASISALIIYQNRQHELQLRKNKAENIAAQRDPAGQSAVSIAVMNFNSAFLSNNFNRLLSPASNKAIKDSIINESFLGYLNKFDTRIYTFDKNYNSIYNEDSVSYQILSNIVNSRTKASEVAGLHYYENSERSFNYIFEREIKDDEGNILGYYFLLANPKRYQSDAVFPELFKQVKDPATDVSMNYSYAVYDNGKLINSEGDYNFTSTKPPGLKIIGDYEVFTDKSNSVLWYNAGSNKYVVIVRQGTILFEMITLFAYLFGTFLFILIVFHVGSLVLKSRFRWRYLREAFRFTIRNQIQTTLLFISVFSFIVIGVVTISFYISRFEENKRERLSKSIHVMGREIERQVSAHEMMDDVVKIYDEGASSQLERTISDISELNDLDVNFYDLSGQLKVSTQPYIYNQRILSKMMEPNAYYRLRYKHEIQVVQQESIGGFSYLSVYIPILNDDKEPYAYINIPYLSSQNELKQEISNFLVTLINVNALIFVLAGVIAIFLTNRITSSFTLIGSKMRDIHLERVNEEITWNTNDEIGILVSEYNKMVKKLEASAQALAKSEREGAWREMARQVAHEIKNPLTPMKLNIQYLQRAIADNKPGIQQLSQKVADTLVEQIDQLAKIASDFSQFANIERANNQVFDVNDVLASLIDLYASNEDLTLVWERPKKKAEIFADKTQVLRLFTNLLKNAIEASSGKAHSTITINQTLNDHNVLIAVEDEGAGIPAEMHDKIFIPNFTTKSSGTGLGLAISKGIVEMANGEIWFTTLEGEGTTFFVQFPLQSSTPV